MSDDFDPITRQPVEDEDLYSRIVGDMAHGQRAMVDEGLDANPDDAAEALQLQDSTGTPAPAIMADQDGFKENLRRQTAMQLVMGNPDLITYLQAHPLAASVSNDDWGNLDKFTRESVGTFTLLKSLNTALDKIGEEELTGLKEGWNSADLSQEYSKYTDPALTGPVGAAVAKIGYGSANLLMQVLGAGMGLASGAAKGVGEAVGGESLGREAQAMTEYELQRGDHSLIEGGGHEPVAAAPKPSPEMEAITKATPWIDAGQEVPAGVHPLIDDAKAKINAQAVDMLMNDLKNAQSSTTKERSPESFKAAIPQSFRDQVISIHSDAALALYGDKPPTLDDGLLGWIPDIDTQLMAARDVGADIHVKVGDWLTYVDPQVANGLSDHLRMWPGGITAEEAKTPLEYKEVIDAPLPQVRGAAGLEPKFAMGDRKLNLQLYEKNPIDVGEGIDNPYGDGQAAEMHNYNILDENGKPVGDIGLGIAPNSKDLYVAWIGGEAGMWANSFGPSLMRDLKRQLKELYPDRESLTGFRVTGARDRAGAEDRVAKVKLDVGGGVDPDEYTKMQGFFQQGWEAYNHYLDVNRTGITPEHEAEGRIASEEIQKLTGGRGQMEGVSGIASAETGQVMSGAYQAYTDKPPTILLDLLGKDVVGSGRHEAVHWLKDNGFFKPEEWSALEQAAKTENWGHYYDIEGRYSDQDEVSKTEEAIAEGFRDWMKLKDNERPKTGVGAVFQKLREFLDRIRQRLGEALGATPTWEQVFERTRSGEVGRREPGAPNREGVFDLRPKASIEGDDNVRAASVGLPQDAFKRLMDQLHKSHAEDVEAAVRREEKLAAQKQTDQWKADRAEVMKDVAKDIRQRPDIAADAFIGQGELYGKKLDQRNRLAADDLTDEQRAALPKDYVGKNGLSPDLVAGMFGYGSKDEFVAALTGVSAMRAAMEKDRLKGSFVSQLIKQEADRRMELRNPGDSAMEEATQRALSETNINIMHDYLVAKAMDAGVTVFSKDVMLKTARDLVNATALGQISSFRAMQLVDRHSRVAEKALVAKDQGTAIKALQQQTLAAMAAKEMLGVEKEMKAFDKVARTNAKRERTSVPPESMNWVHSILTQIGKPIKRSAEDLAREIEHANSGSKTLADFVQYNTINGGIMPVWEQLFDDQWKKPYKDLTVDEFRNVRDSVKTIIKNGRDELKVIKAGEAVDFETVKAGLIDGLESQFPQKTFGAEGEITSTGKDARAGLARHTWARLLTVETILNRWDKFDWKGPWQQLFFRPLSEGANQLSIWEKEMGKTIRDIVNRPSLSGTIPNTLFRDPINGSYYTMTRENLRAIMANMGTESNFDKLVRGDSLPKFDHKITQDDVKAWVDKVATKEDWDFVQGIWDNLKTVGERSSNMYRQMSEVPMKSIEPVKIQTPFGEYAGGYYPIKFHPEYEGKSAKLSGISLDGLFGSGYSTGFAPNATYKIERTDYAAPLAKTMDQLPSAIREQLRDAALRPALANASKILRDAEVRDAIKSRYGSEYNDMLKEYLRRIAGTENRGGAESQFGRLTARTLDFARQNLIADLVGFNPGTIIKHGMTAFTLSAKEVGPVNMLRAMRQLYEVNPETGQTWRRFAYENGEELQRRSRNWEENLFGSTDPRDERGWWGQTRAQFIEWGSKPIALADALSSEPTWLAAYVKERDAGGNHGDATEFANRAVRRAHGSTSMVSQPMIMSHLNPWIVSLYNFFNDILNRATETMWKAGEMVGAAKAGDWDKAKGLAPGIAAGAFATVIWPAIVENLVSPQASSNDESTTSRVLKGSVHAVAAMFPVVRDFAEYVTGNSDPNVGLLSTEIKSLFEATKDVFKKNPTSPAHAEKFIRDFGTMTGALVGAPGMQIGREAGFAYGLATGAEHPRGPWGWMVGGRFGTIKGHSPTWNDYVAGRSLPNR